MDAERFDDVVRFLSNANESSRRDVFAGLTAGLLVGLLTLRDPEAAEARNKRRKRKNKKKKKKPLPPPITCTPSCVGKICGDDGCGGVCGVICAQYEPFTICCQGDCKFPTSSADCCAAIGEFCSPDGGFTFGSTYCCSKNCDVGGSNLCQ